MAGANTNILQDIEKVWKDFAPDSPFDYFYLDEDMHKVYAPEARLVRIAVVFGIVALLLTCGGLYNLVVSLSQQRIKEIGVRKVNGAKTSEILTMLNVGFVRLVVLSVVIATPLAVVILDMWLSHYANRIQLDTLMFIITITIVLFITLITVSWQSWRAATRNPVEALRYE